MKKSILLPVYNRKDLLYNTLTSFDYFYKNKEDLEVVLVDDCSAKEHRFENVENDFPNLNIKYKRINEKYGFNPSLAYNVAARIASGDIFILSSPETFHTCNIFDLCNNFDDFQTSDYYLFSVFCLTKKQDKNLFLDTNKNVEDKINYFNSIKNNLYENLGCNGYDFNNDFGSWYLHENIKPSKLNFLTALSKELYYQLCGFNQAFMQGTGYDDTDFLDRLEPNIKNFKWFNDAVALHIDHDLAANIPQNSNSALYQKMKNKIYKTDLWGILPR